MGRELSDKHMHTSSFQKLKQKASDKMRDCKVFENTNRGRRKMEMRFEAQATQLGYELDQRDREGEQYHFEIPFLLCQEVNVTRSSHCQSLPQFLFNMMKRKMSAFLVMQL